MSQSITFPALPQPITSKIGRLAIAYLKQEQAVEAVKVATADYQARIADATAAYNAAQAEIDAINAEPAPPVTP